MFDSLAVQNLRDEVVKLEKSTAQVRKGLFARHMGLEKYMTELRDQIEVLQREIYQLRKKVAESSDQTQITEYEKVM